MLYSVHFMICKMLSSIQDDETIQVLNQIHDGAIDEIITGLCLLQVTAHMNSNRPLFGDSMFFHQKIPNL